MKIAIAADLHFRGKKLTDKIQAWERAMEKIVGVDALIFAGDVFDTRNIGGREASMGTVYRGFVKPFEKLHGVKAGAVLGNHELATGDQLSALEILKETPLSVFDSFGQVHDFPDVIIAYIPWVPDSPTRAEDLKRWLLTIKRAFALKPDKFKLVVGHITVRGAQLNSGITLQGSEFEVTQEQLEDLGADLVCLGHIHRRQWFGDKICYVGALTQDGFGDEGNPQGFMIVDTDKRTHEFVEIDSPKYVTLKGEDKMPSPLPADTDYVKYRLKERPENLDELLSNPRVTVEIVPDREAVVRSVEGIEPGRTNADMLYSYLKSKGFLEADRERIVKLSNEMAEAMK